MTAAHTPEPRAAEPPPTAQRSMADLVRAAVSGWLGTALEFMDFQLYSLAAALVFSQLFFSGESPGMAVVLSMATYGVGYIARPLGAIFFGRLGDRIGASAIEDHVDDADRLVDARDVGAIADEPFAQEKPERQLAVAARRPHDDGKRLPVDAHLERRLDGDLIR